MLEFLQSESSIWHWPEAVSCCAFRSPLADSFVVWICSVVRVWDVRPFAPKERCVKIFQGNVHNFEKVSFAWQRSFIVHLILRNISGDAKYREEWLLLEWDVFVCHEHCVSAKVILPTETLWLVVGSALKQACWLQPP